MKRCHLCGQEAVTTLIDFGDQPLCNRFLSSPEEDEEAYPLTLGQCGQCALIQISDPITPDALRPRHRWIEYKEPEDHLEHLADLIGRLPSLTRDADICGLSQLDDPLLDRLKRRGFNKVWRIDPSGDLGIRDARAGIETIQDHINPETAGKIASAHGKQDMVIAGFILEHAHHLQRFIEGLKALVKDDGFIVVSVPETRGDLEILDYSKIWAEHVLYFTSETFFAAPSFFDLTLVHQESYPYRLANCLVGIWQPKEGVRPLFPQKEVLDDEIFVVRGYAEKFSPTRREIKALVRSHKRDGDHLALFGAGHLACMFVNLMGIKEDLDFVVDDDPKKQGYFLPGSRLPIYSATALLEREIGLCLLGLNPEKEDAILENNRAFIDQGGRFFSIFPSSRRALLGVKDICRET